MGYDLAGPAVRAAAAGPFLPLGRPNIILITLDTVRADHLSSYGYPRPTTQNLDKWVGKGVVFENAIAPTSWTLASHASMFTGSLPHQHGADWRTPLRTSRLTLADVLKAWGYETAGFTSNIAYGEAGWGMDDGFDLYEDNRRSLPHSLMEMKLGMRVLDPLYQRWLWPDYFERRDATRVNQDVLDWFQGRSPRPFFLFINYFDVHDPYLAPRYFAHRFGNAPPKLMRKMKFAFTTQGVAHLSAQDQAALVAGYDNSLASLDQSVGDLLNSLSHLPQWQNTVVIITSDHGEGFGEHGTYGHGMNLYREELRVPLLIFGMQVPAGIRVSKVVSTQDLFSTVLKFAANDVAQLSPTALQRYWTLAGDAGDLDELAVAELTPKFESTGRGAEMSLWTRDWEYIRNAQGGEELYRWTQDPGEQVNLAGSAEYRPVVDAFRARLFAVIRDSRRPWQGPQYLAGSAGLQQSEVNVAAAPAELSSSGHVPVPHIGDAQDLFPPRPVLSAGALQPPDEELLQSLPYH